MTRKIPVRLCAFGKFLLIFCVQVTLRALHVPTGAAFARYVHVHTTHHDLDRGLSLPAYEHWFLHEVHVDTTIVSVERGGLLHAFAIYYTWDREKYVESSDLLFRTGSIWYGELLVFRCGIRSNKLVNLRTKDDGLAWEAIKMYAPSSRCPFLLTVCSFYHTASYRTALAHTAVE